MKIVIYILYFFFYSAVGWLGESIYCSVGARKWVNRGFLTGPLCPIYGTGALALAITLTPLKNLDIRLPIAGHSLLITPVLVFIAGMVVADIVEFITSVLMEKLFHARWWDYSNKRFNIQGRICLGHTIYWGVGTILFMYIVHPIVEACFARLLDSVAIAALIIILIIFAADLSHAVYKAMDVRKLMDKIHKVTAALTNAKDGIKNNVTEYVESMSEKRDGLSERFEQWRTDTTAQIKDMLPSIPEPGAKKAENKQEKKRHKKKLNRHMMNSPNLLPSINRQMKKLEDMFEEIKRAFSDDSDDDLY